MRFWLILFFLSLFLLSPSRIFASARFDVEHDVTYKVQEDLTTKVTQNIHITNLKTESLAKEFILKLKNPNITDLKAFDQSGSLPIDKYSVPGGIEMRIQFRKLASGEGKTLHWSLSYNVPDMVKKVGRHWKINLPKTPTTSEADDVTVGLYVPARLGTLIQARPKPNIRTNIWSGEVAKSQILTTFSKDTNSPYQAYAFNLDYHLENKGLTPDQKKLALPPDTAYQKVFLTSLSPKPLNIEKDSDGNWLAIFSLASKEVKHIKAQGYVAVFDQPVFPEISPTATSLLRRLELWDTTHPLIQTTMKSLTSPESIYNFVTAKLTYDKTKVQNNPNRSGAVLALRNNLSAICTDFTDLFVTLARAKGIPAREINGYAYTDDHISFPLSLEKDILHAWPEFYDQPSKNWRMVDPTWGKTSNGLDYFNAFDFDHLTLAIHGQDATLPQAAGFYKNSTKLKKFISTKPEPKDVHISPVDKDLPISDHGHLTITELAPSLFLITNVSHVSSLPQTLVLHGTSHQIPSLPPLSHTEFDLETNPFAKMTRWISNLFPNFLGSTFSKTPTEK